MRATGAVVSAFEAKLGVKLEAELTEEFSERLRPLENRFESIDALRFGQSLATRVHAGPALEAELKALHLGDLLLALACLEHDAVALSQLDAQLALVVGIVARRSTTSERDELEQELRIRLLVPRAGAPAKLTLYAGRGPLGGFARVVALNLLHQARASVRLGSDTELAGMPDRADWESQVLRVDQQAQFREAFRLAVQSLSARQRALLRLNLLDGLPIDELAPLYAAHRSSIARWLAEARAALDAQTRKLLGELLRLPEDEIERLLASTQSGFELSLGRALRESVPPRAP